MSSPADSADLDAEAIVARLAGAFPLPARYLVGISGGLDSTTWLAMARADGFEPYALSFAYGQRHAVELEKAREYAPRIGAVAHQVVEIDLRQFGGSALTVRLEPGSGAALRIGTRRYANQPTLAFPWTQ